MKSLELSLYFINLSLKSLSIIDYRGLTLVTLYLQRILCSFSSKSKNVTAKKIYYDGLEVTEFGQGEGEGKIRRSDGSHETTPSVI